MSFPKPKIIDVNGIQLEIFEAGEGKPLVLCHGWPEHAYSWRYQIEPLVELGYHVIIPNQRGYGNSSAPESIEDYDIEQLTGDLCGVLDHFGYDDACFIGHDWGAIVVWNMALIHPNRLKALINLSVPFMERGPTEWVSFWESHLGGDFYIVHFNRQPGVADAAFEKNLDQFLENIYRTNQWKDKPIDLGPGMNLITLASSPKLKDGMTGDPLMSPEDLAVFRNAFQISGFSGGINWYRNFSRNWGILAKYPQQVNQPALMIYGDYDSVPKSSNLEQFVPNVTEVSFDCGHWIQQERPSQTNTAVKEWLAQHYPI